MLISMAMVVAVGMISLNRVDLHSARNQCILGLSLLFPLCIAAYVKDVPDAFRTGENYL